MTLFSAPVVHDKIPIFWGFKHALFTDKIGNVNPICMPPYTEACNVKKSLYITSNSLLDQLILTD